MKSRTLKLTSLLFVVAILLSSCAIFKGNSDISDAKKKAKEFEKQGYKAVGAGTLERYIQEAIEIEFAKDDKGQKENMVVYTKATGPSFQNAREACISDVNSTIARQVETRVTGLIKRSLNNDQISARAADGINKTVSATKEIIAQKISTNNIYTFSREIADERDGKTLVQIEYASFYSVAFGDKIAKEMLKEKLTDEAEDLHKELDTLFDEL